MTGTGTGRKQQHSISDEIDATPCSRFLEKELEKADLRQLADFFLLLDKWDKLQSTQARVEPSDKREVA